MTNEAPIATSTSSATASSSCPMSRCCAQLGPWLSQRLGLEQLLQLASKKQVPLHQHSLWYYLGGVAMMFIGVQILTGALLMVYYIPHLESAHASILKLNSQIEFGWFIRSLHSWGANLMIVALFIHMFSTYFMKAYRGPRELTWLTGLGLLGLAFGFGFTGYLLPWDEVAYFATKIGIDIAAQTPIIGENIADLLRGGPSVGQATLSRFFVIHVMALPLALAGLLGLHLMLVQTHGMSEPASVAQRPDKQSEPFFPNFFLKDLMVWMLILNILAACATLAPWGLGPEADPAAPAPLGIKPEWYFLAMFQLLKCFPAHVGPFEGEHVGLTFFGLIGLLFVMMPFWDNGQSATKSRLATGFGLVVLIGFIGLTLWGLLV